MLQRQPAEPIHRLLALLTVTALSTSIAATADGLTDKNYQKDMDIVRLNDLRTIGEYLQEYHRNTGHYPYTGYDQIEHVVFIGSKSQVDQIRGGGPVPPRESLAAEFEAELERVLGRDIYLPFDPQNVSVYKPVVYLYMTRGQEYYLAVHLYQKFKFANQVAEHYNKLEVTNRFNPDMKLWGFDHLMADRRYRKAARKKMKKHGFIEEMRGMPFDNTQRPPSTWSKVDAKTYRELIAAVRADELDTVKRVAGSGLNLNPSCPPYMACQPLAHAAEEGKFEAVRILVKNGADPNGWNAYGDTPLIRAFANEHTEVARWMVEHGGDVNIANSFGHSPFSIACGHEPIEVVRYMVDHGADVNVRYFNRTSQHRADNGWTALIMAAKQGRADVVALLLENDADPMVRDIAGKTAYDYARDAGHAEVIELLTSN